MLGKGGNALTAILKLREYRVKKNDMVMLAAIIAMLIMAVIVLQSFLSISDKKAEYNELDAKCSEQVLINAEMASLLEESDEEYIERVAREKLDMVYPGERVFINSSGN